MHTHGLLSLPFSKDRATSTYDLENPGDHIHQAAGERAEDLGVDLLPFDVSSQAQLDTALAAMRNCSAALIDAHGSQGDLCLGSSATRIAPIDLALRISALELLVVGACWQEFEKWEKAAPPGCLVISYTGKLLAGASHGLILHTADLRDLQGIPEGPSGAKVMADWVQSKSHHASNRATEWFVFRAAS